MQPVISGYLRGSKRRRALIAHRAFVYQSAYVKFLFGECSLDYLNSRLTKLLELGVMPNKIRPESKLKKDGEEYSKSRRKGSI